MYVHAFMYVCMYVCARVCVCLCMYVCMCVHVYVCVHIYYLLKLPINDTASTRCTMYVAILFPLAIKTIQLYILLHILFGFTHCHDVVDCVISGSSGASQLLACNVFSSLFYALNFI